MKSIINPRKTISKSTVQLRVEEATAERLKIVRNEIKALSDVDSSLDSRIEDGLVKCLEQAEKELAEFKSRNRETESV